VLESDGLVVSCPWASRLPYETVVAPAKPEAGAFASPRLPAALVLLAQVIRRLHALEGQVPLNAWLEYGDNDWRLVLLPRLTMLASLELGAGIFINTLPPEEAAERLRSA
jgi:UDPglucose--hexose-1-phosphate uridylyltransferase